MRALRFVMCYSCGYAFRIDFGFIKWLTTSIKAAICLIFGLEDNKYYDKECIAQYDGVFNEDHYDWMSVFVVPGWFNPWKIAIVLDGE